MMHKKHRSEEANFVNVEVRIIGPKFEHEALLHALQDAHNKSEETLHKQLRDAQGALSSQVQQLTTDLDIERKARADRQCEHRALKTQMQQLAAVERKAQHDAQEALKAQLQQAATDLDIERKAHADRQCEHETLLLLNKYEGGPVDENVGNYYHADSLEPILTSVDSSIAALDIITESLSVSVLSMYSILNKLSDIATLPDADVAALAVVAKSLACTITALAPNTAKLVSVTVSMLSTLSEEI
jgi:multidrug efflux pump subunit AcrA (membrane-fusion protein)